MLRTILLGIFLFLIMLLGLIWLDLVHVKKTTATSEEVLGRIIVKERW